MKKNLRGFINRFLGINQIVARTKQAREQVEEEGQHTRLLLGKILTNQVRAHGVYENIHEAEFQVFSQFGDDGILQYLINQTQPEVETFIEFGVQDYSEANTRFLLLNNNWRGLIMDGAAQSMNALRADELYWRHDLTAVGAFITRENVNQLFLDNGFSGEIGLLSIDIDGNDYWVWEAIQMVSPVLVVIEYNSVFGAEHAITIPYDSVFYRTEVHYSNLYWGASLKALCILAEKKGYAFVGCNSNGNNAHFVRKDKIGQIPVLTCQQGYVESKFRESRDQNGNLTFIFGKSRLNIIQHMLIFDVETNSLKKIQELDAG